LETNIVSPAGSYFYQQGRSGLTDWHTYDQALCSAALLDGPNFRLVEGQTRILRLPILLRDNGRLKAGFDHLPILVTVRQVDLASRVSE
jgi:hypothetical protein